MASSKKLELLAIALAIAGMAAVSVEVFNHNQEKFLESFLSCGDTCRVSRAVTPQLFGIITAKILWVLFGLAAVAGAVAYENRHASKRRWIPEKAGTALHAVSGAGAAVALYSAYQSAFVLQNVTLLHLAITLLALATLATTLLAGSNRNFFIPVARKNGHGKQM